MPPQPTDSEEWEKGDLYENDDAVFIITDTKKKTVIYKAPVNKKNKKITVPSTVKFKANGKTVTYKVTGIAKGAFTGCKQLKEVTIGKNITKIENDAFKGASNLKMIIIQSKSIKDLGKTAFRGIGKQCTVKVPKSRVAYYKKLLYKKGLKRAVRIK